MKFNLEEKQLKAIEKWKKSLPESPTGAIGGRFEYSFVPTNLGLVVKVKDAITKSEIDVSDYESW